MRQEPPNEMYVNKICIIEKNTSIPFQISIQTIELQVFNGLNFKLRYIHQQDCCPPSNWNQLLAGLIQAGLPLLKLKTIDEKIG